ncbi:putative late blight resistance protein homolog R1A-10 [Rhododendron vialii]|uniref:putative late blight resistance protein homolog R1A-10 n=1 Tax=Rhododendron vialii TaxID=182163 RepID=UPI00265E3B16|nr:putative late blight resistance protein homolog R1A-10 [Rhododendron vialii]
MERKLPDVEKGNVVGFDDSKDKLFLSILKRVTQVTSDMSNMGEDELAEEVHRQLTWKYLIVVDDVWEKDWDSIKKKKVFDGGDCPQEDLKDVRIRIEGQCDGLPLTGLVIAGMLQNDISKDAWETIAKSVKAFLVRKEEDLMEVLALSYYHLPPHLKACFLYFGVFLQDCKIPFWILIRLWIAETFVQTSENVCLEEMAKEHLKDLVARNLLLVEQRSFSGRIKTCHIHDMLRELCFREALAENFLLEIKEGGTNSP